MDYYNSDLKAIETYYKGFHFRSRLEARWAVFMDALNIEWLYEHEGYDLNGIWYLPDFYLPKLNGGCFMEVKPISLNKIEIGKASKLSILSGKVVILAIGLPGEKKISFVYPEICGGIKNYDFGEFYLNKNSINNSYSSFSTGYLEAINIAKGVRF